MELVAQAPATSGRSYSQLAAEVGVAVPHIKKTPVPAWATLAPAPAAPAVSLLPRPEGLLPGVVYETTEYDLFHLLPENRVVDLSHVRKLVTQIAKTNLLNIKPMDVTDDLGIIDGQHRLAAARELGYPIFYRITPELSEEDIAKLNVAQKNWTGTDYLHYWTVKGKPAYQLLTAFMQRYPQISFSNAKLMLGYNDTGSTSEFKAGEFRTSDPQMSEATATLILRISQECRFAYAFDTRFLGAVHHCVAKVKGFDGSRFVQKIMLQPAALMRQATHKQYLEMFASIYNYKSTEAYKLRFE